jgi:hypothetical protein
MSEISGCNRFKSSIGSDYGISDFREVLRLSEMLEDWVPFESADWNGFPMRSF